MQGMETSMKIYEVGGIAGKYHIVLEEDDEEAVTVMKQIPIQYSFLGGKHINTGKSGGQILRPSKKGAEVMLETSASLLVNLKMSLVGVKDELISKDFYGKVIKQADKNRYMIRFTSVPPEVSA